MPLGTAKRPVTERETLIAELMETQRNLADANARFNMVTQPELIEQCVYEVNALKARHAYYIRVLREEEGIE
jgi:hypothetical protein